MKHIETLCIILMRHSIFRIISSNILFYFILDIAPASVGWPKRGVPGKTAQGIEINKKYCIFSSSAIGSCD
jgi:hypothetical protein